MPYEVVRDEQACSPSNPWACRNSETDEVMGCHETRDAAMAQMRALMANVPDAGTRASKTIDFDALGLEKRSVEFSDVSLSADGTQFSGYASIYDYVADLGDFFESVQRGAFRKVLGSGQDIPFLYDHDLRPGPLATTGAGTLRLREDGKGLRVEADLNRDHLMFPTLRSQMERGEVRGMSFGFIAGAGNSKIEHRGNKLHRILTGFRSLLDVSPTWTPAYAGTSAELRSALATLRMAEDVEPLQPVLSGSYQQLEDNGADGSGTDDQADNDDCPTEPVSEVVEEEEQRSGVDSTFKVEAAARRRRLHMMGLTLPKDIGPA